MVDNNLKLKISKTKKSFLQNVKFYFKEYCNCSSVHGLRYFVEKERTRCERIWWIAILMSCLIVCAFCISKIYDKWERNAIIINFANKGTSIFNIPFPAITICPESKFAKNKMDVGVTLGGGELEYISLICEEIPSNLNMSEIQGVSNQENSTSSNFVQDFLKAMHSLKPEFNISYCNLFGFASCEPIWATTVTDEGLCYNFNLLRKDDIFRQDVQYLELADFALPDSNWSLDDGYSKNEKAFSYPVRVHMSGARHGLKLDILTSDGSPDGCGNSGQGYKVLLHSPMDIPNFDQEYFKVQLNQSVVVVVKPTMITTAESLKKFSAKRRGCFFQSERPLLYFKQYTLRNCKLECLTNYTFSLCGCVNFFMPRTNETEICNHTKKICMESAENMMVLNEIKNWLENDPEKNKNEIKYILDEKREVYESENKKLEELKCDCLPNCSDLSYDVEISQSDLHWNEQILSYDRNGKNLHLSSFSIFFKSEEFVSSERNELYGPIDFVAHFGGLLGLFSGFSVVSLIEILYFLSVRIFYNKRLFGHWAGDRNEST